MTVDSSANTVKVSKVDIEYKNVGNANLPFTVSDNLSTGKSMVVTFTVGSDGGITNATVAAK